MRKLQLTTMLSTMFFALLSAFVFVSCTNTPDEPVDTTTKVVFDSEELSIDYDGGELSVGYTITNGLAGIDIVASSNVEWISDFVAKDGVLKFNVASNGDAEERKAFITVKYPNVDNLRLVLTQAPFDGVSFAIEVKNQSSTSCTTVITPSDDETMYIAMMADIDYFYQAGITNAEELFLDDYNYYMGIAEEYNVELIREFLLMNEMAFTGESNITWTNMTPGKDYYIYVYAIEVNETNSDYYMISPISYEKILLEAGTLREVEFDVTVDVSGPDVTYHITPINWDGKYYLDVYEEGDWMYRAEGSTLDESYATTVSNTWLGMITTYMNSGYTAEQLVEIMCLEGEQSYSENRKAATNYSMILYTIEMIDGLPQVTSKPYLVNFATEEVGRSDMQIEIEVENCYVRVADVVVTPSNDDPYTIALVSTAEIPDSTDAEIISWLTDNFYLSTYRGSIFSHLNTLVPESEYTVLAFGYYGGTVTTDLFRYDFKTEAAGECLNSVVTVNWGGPYSLLELEAYDPDNYYNYGMFEAMGWFAMWSEIVTAEPATDVFHCIYRADRFAFEGEQAIFDDLVSYACPTTQLLTGESGVLYVMCAVTMDYKGNYSDMWVSDPFTYEYSADTKLPIDELLAKIAAPTPLRQSVKLL